MRQACKHPLCLGILLLCLYGTAHAAENLQPSYPEVVWNDVKYVLSSPARWNNQDWKNFALATAGVVGVGAILDRPIQDEMRRHAPNDNTFLLYVERFGAQYSFVVLGGFYAAGAAGNNSRALAVAQDGLAASLIATGIITPAIKFITGRARPRENLGIAAFRSTRAIPQTPLSLPDTPPRHSRLLPWSQITTKIPGWLILPIQLPVWWAQRAFITMPISLRTSSQAH